MARRRASVAPKQGASGILGWLEATISQIMEEARTHGVVTGIGVGFGGPVQSRTGRVLISHQNVGWDGIHRKEWMEARFFLPTVIENDANAADWAFDEKDLAVRHFSPFFQGDCWFSVIRTSDDRVGCKKAKSGSRHKEDTGSRTCKMLFVR